MSGFEESQHPRNLAGRFAAKAQSEGEVNLGRDRVGDRPVPPAGWRENADGSAVCPHRNLSVCPDCAKEPELVEGAGAYFWIGDPTLRAEAEKASAVDGGSDPGLRDEESDPRAPLASKDVSPHYREPTVKEHHGFLRGLPAYVEVEVTTEGTPDRNTRLMARDLPRGSFGLDRDIPRRFTDLGHGTEWFINDDPEERNEFTRIKSVVVDRESFVKNWPDRWSHPNGLEPRQVERLMGELRHTNMPITATYTDPFGESPSGPVKVVRIDMRAEAVDGPVVIVRDQPGEPTYGVPVGALKE